MRNLDNIDSLIQFEIDFYSKLNVDEVKLGLSSFLSLNYKSKEELLQPVPVHSQYFTLLREKGGKYTLSTSFLYYTESRIFVIRILKWLQKNATTDRNCGFGFGIIFQKYGKRRVPDLSKIDMLKFILDFPEEKVYKLFPERKNSFTSKSIKKIYPGTKFFVDTVASLRTRNFSTPFERYYGIDFTRLKDGILFNRYIGGDYFTKEREIQEVIDLTLESVRSTVENPVLSDKNVIDLKEIADKQSKTLKIYASVEKLTEVFPDIKFTVDLNTDSRICDNAYPYIRDKIFNLIVESGMESGYLNYNTDTGKLQIKDCVLTDGYLLKDIDIFDSEINATIVNCDIFSSIIKNSDIRNSNLFNGSIAEDCTFYNSYVNVNSIINNSNFEGNLGILSGKMEGGRFFSGMISQNAELKDVDIISYEKIN